MREWAHFSAEEQDGGGTRIVLSGPLRVSTIGALDIELRNWEGEASCIDISDCETVDTVGAWLVWRFAQEQGAEITGASREARLLIETVATDADQEQIRPPVVSMLRYVPQAIGTMVYNWRDGMFHGIGFLGNIIVAFWHVMFKPSRWRVTSLVRQFELVGVDSLGIIGLMSFLIGIVIAQQGAVQLRQFGAEIYTINLTGRLALRELGILMTAIMVAGRSGSAFAAQIGTMKLTEEVDAMRTIGVSPMEALIIPRVMACVLLMPLLGFYASVIAIIGGAFISELTLGIPFGTFLMRIQEVVPTHDLWVGLIKGLVFGLIVGLAGCFQGMQVKGNSEDVGLRTTMAVVQGIFMVIVLDAFFAVFFSEVGWG